ncbi:hypothetical protein TTHERM_00320300 (macronuclear) [Tetrahymena thermophila SB210]|uniref:Uncharacterized protein n=1 Tax=Tetrahymena thermophila (strain SB210) TaxID=312017 RepID=Q237Q7_TETTS|nr:hypothetical protein TTHERM_00320300 [Tetrahymena thermophila SB210]EAR92684.2 hypothetical protein TTHERM_00320300 [Tetrahymena thermophila SB210]|eukprot:XP_001012929.2 hypothetical protein TTHERM_00320300 [Tetrahymena thermophila SB210]
MIQNQLLDANKDESKLSSVYLKIYLNEQIQELPAFQSLISQIRDKLIDLKFQKLDSQRQQLLVMKYEPSSQTRQLINKIIQFLKSNTNNQSIIDDVELEILIMKANIINLQMLHQTLEKILHDVSKFKLVCKSEINEKQLKQIIQTLKELRVIESFQFICQDRLLLFEKDLDTQFINEIQGIIVNSKTFIFNNQQPQKGYNSHEICTIPGLLSKSISIAQNLLNLEINFNYAGWIKRNRESIILAKFLDDFTFYLSQWPTQLQVIKVGFDRLICCNANYNNINVQKFLKEFANMLSKQNNLRELYLNLEGIGYRYNQIYPNIFNELCLITQSIKTVNILKLLIGGKIELSQKDWNTFFQGISSINNLQDLELNVEWWVQNVDNLTQEQQYNIINSFINDLVSQHKYNLQRLILNVDNWAFLFQVNILDLLQRISKFENLVCLQLLHSKTKNLEQFNLLKQAEQYYSTLQSYTINMIITQNTFKKSQILEIVNQTLKNNFSETIQNVYKNLASQNLFKEDKDLRTSKIKRTSDFIIRCIQSILDFQFHFLNDLQENFYNISIVQDPISQITLFKKQSFIETYFQQNQDHQFVDSN